MKTKNKKPRTSVQPIKSSFCDIEWTYYIAFLVECDETCNNFISALHEIEMSNPKIRVIRKQEVLNDLKSNKPQTTKPPSTPKKGDNSAQKLAKDSNSSGPPPVVDENLEKDEKIVLDLLKANKDHYVNLPPQSLANIVKRYLGKLKDNYITTKKPSSSGSSKKASAEKETKGKAGGGSSKKTPDGKSKTSDDKKSKKQKPTDEIEKPQLPEILIFTGFYEPLLPLEMAKLNLPVRAVVALTKHTTSTSENAPAKKSQDLDHNLTSKKFNFDFYKFWSYSGKGNDELTLEKSEDIANVDIELPEQIAVLFEKRTKHLSATTKKDLKLNINKFLSNLATHLLNSIDLHTQSINNVETYDLSAEYRPLDSAKHYLHLSSLLPYECSDVSFVLYNMVEQVSVWHNDKLEIFSTIKNDESSLKIINHNNSIDLRTFHLCPTKLNYDIHYVLSKYLSTNHVYGFWLKRDDRITKKQKALNKFHLRRLFKLEEDVDQYLFDLYLHWFILCHMKQQKRGSKIKRSSTKIKMHPNFYVNHNRLFRDSIAIKKGPKWQKELGTISKRFCSMSVSHVNKMRKENLKDLKKFIEIPEIIKLVQKDRTIEELLSNENDSLYKFAEDLKPICLLQTVQELCFNYLVCDKYHFKTSNKILLWFHNDIGITSKKDRFKVVTFLGFRDYYKTNMKEESIDVSNLLKNIDDYRNKRSSENNGADSSVLEDATDISEKLDIEHPKVKLCDLWGSEMELETFTESFVSADSSYVLLEIDQWLNMTKTMKIAIKKRNTELIYYKDLHETHDQGDPVDSIYSNAVLNLPDGTRVCVDVEEKYLPERYLKLFYNFSICLPSGLSIEVVRVGDDYYVKQKYIFPSTLTESIKNEKYRCYVKGGHVIIFHKSGKIKILYNNGTIVSVNKIVNNPKTEAAETKPDVPEVNKKDLSGKDKKKTKKKVEDNKKKQDLKSTDGKKPLMKSDDRLKFREISKSDQLIQEFEPLKDVNKNNLTVLKQSVTTAYGERFTYNDGVYKIKKPFSLRTIYQPNQALFIGRSDEYNALYIDDGTLVSTFPDKTRMSSVPGITNLNDSEGNLHVNSSLVGFFLRESSENNAKNFLDEDFPDEKYSFNVINSSTLVEHPLYAGVEYNLKQCPIKITLPGGIVVYVMENMNDFLVKVDPQTNVKFSKENIVFSCGLLKTGQDNNVTVINCVSETLGLNKEVHKPPTFCKTVDSFGSKFLIHSDGATERITATVRRSNPSLETVSGSGTLTRGFYFNGIIPRGEFERFLVVNRDFSGHEILHKEDVEMFLYENRLKNKKIKITTNPTCVSLKSKTIQYPLFENYFERYLPPSSDLEYCFPGNIVRCALKKPGNKNKSLWLFEAEDYDERKSTYADTYQPPKNNSNNKPLAIVYRTVNEICKRGDNKLKKIALVLLRYEEINKEIFHIYSRKRFKRRSLLNKIQIMNEI